MRALADARRHLRERTEHVLLQAAMEQLRREHPASTVAPPHDRRDVAWRALFVPLYRRIPWETKVRAMRLLGMTAERSGWSAPERRPGEPWRPPRVTDGGDPGQGAGVAAVRRPSSTSSRTG